MDRKTLELFNHAFEAMAKEVERQGISGTGVAAYLEDAETIDWQLSIRVFGKIEIPPHDDSVGWNLIGMACSKAAESIMTKVKSGSAPRTLEHGEVGYPGAEVQSCGKGYVVADFGGARDEQDYEVAKAGVAAMVAELV